jgi:hypothetical protein
MARQATNSSDDQMRDFASTSSAVPARLRWVTLVLFFLWLGLVLFLLSRHAFWRDEVRALSIAVSGENIVEMLKGLRGEGHPALWYLLLRGAHSMAGSQVVLPAMSLAIAAAAALLLALRSPFHWGLIALLLLSNFFLFEYTVVARNYGISVLLLFLLADRYPRNRDRGILLGILLALLANTNVHSVLLVVAFLLFWLIDILCAYGMRWTPAFKTFALNAAVSAAGIAVCVATIYPTYNDAAIQAGGLAPQPAKAILLPGAALINLVLSAVLTLDLSWNISPGLALTLQALATLIVLGSTLALVRSPGAFLAALAALVAFSFFFFVVSWGGYRHQGLWLFFLVSLYWIVQARGAATEPCIPVSWKSFVTQASAIGSAVMVLLVAQQVPAGLKEVALNLSGAPPRSRARDLGALIAARRDLQAAIIVADPDTLIEALPYYIDNRTYLLREQRFGNVIRFTSRARLSIELDDVLVTAKRLHSESGKPILILLHQQLDPTQPRIYQEGYNWILRTTPEAVRNFLAATRIIAQFAPASTDESFGVYLLDESAPRS